MKIINKDILVTIFNHNNNDNAIILMNMFSNNFETVVIDSGSSIKNESFILCDNIYYNGLINKSYDLLLKSGKKFLLFLTSDVIIDKNNYNKLILRFEQIEDFVGVYSPSVDDKSKAHIHCINKTGYGIADVLFVEGYFTLVNKIVMDNVCPINTKINKFGWCTDLLIGYHSNELNLNTIIDHTIIIHHPHGTGYDTDLANYEMNSYFKYLNNQKFNNFALKALKNGNK